MSMSIDDSERYLRLMLGGMKYAVRYWEDRDKEESDIEQTNVEAVKTALATMRKYQKIVDIVSLNGEEFRQCGLKELKEILEVIADGKTD